MNTVYIDFEYDNNGDIIEIGAICVAGGYILKEFHCFIRRDIYLYKYNVCAHNSHCIHPSILNINGIYEEWAFNDFKNFFLSIKGIITIKGHGKDITKSSLENQFSFLKELPINYVQVNLPVWSVRQYEKSHIAALGMKLCTRLISCNRDNHKMSYQPTWLIQGKTPNHTKIAKLAYGAHCALIDCYEMAFYDEKLELFCCDEHFANYFICETTPGILPAYDDSFNPLIVHSPLIFIDDD